MDKVALDSHHPLQGAQFPGRGLAENGLHPGNGMTMPGDGDGFAIMLRRFENRNALGLEVGNDHVFHKVIIPGQQTKSR